MAGAEPRDRPDDVPAVRTGQGDTTLSREEFTRRFHERFDDPAFDQLGSEIDRLTDVAWDGYINSRKSPRTRKAGPEFVDPDYDLSID